LRRSDLSIRSLRPDDADAQCESDEKKKEQSRAKRRKDGVHT
jgi:hypothetical protein